MAPRLELDAVLGAVLPPAPCQHDRGHGGDGAKNGGRHHDPESHSPHGGDTGDRALSLGLGKHLGS